jgi:hypothetical protein
MKLAERIVRMHDRGATWKEIGTKLGISPGTAAHSYKSIKPLPPCPENGCVKTKGHGGAHLTVNEQL